MKLRRLTEKGIGRFADFLEQLRSDPTIDLPKWLLEDEDSSEYVADVEVDELEFSDRLAAAIYLDELFSKAHMNNVDQDVGLWAWLTLFHFDQVCPKKQANTRKPFKEEYRYIPASSNFQKYYRHLLFGPYVVYRAHKDTSQNAMCLLAGPVHVTNDIIEQLASRNELVSNPSVVEAATRLYIDSVSGDFKKGAKGSGKGSPRRFHKVLEQFDLTFDIYGSTADRIIELLPKEFDRFVSVDQGRQSQ